MACASRSSSVPSILTLPNLISASRIVWAIAFLVSESIKLRLTLLVVASLSDFLDGWVARRLQIVSRLGALIDPIADRLFVASVVVSYLVGGHLSWWQALAVMFRDIMSVTGWFVARNVSWLRPITFRARLAGKLVTVFQLAAFIAVLVLPAWVSVLVLLVAILGLIATTDYTLMLWRERLRSPEESGHSLPRK